MLPVCCSTIYSSSCCDIIGHFWLPYWCSTIRLLCFKTAPKELIVAWAQRFASVSTSAFIYNYKTWLYDVEFKVEGANFHIPASSTYLISLPFPWQNCRRTFVMVLKGLSASKLRELVIQPISETTQSFQHWQEWVSACGQNFPAKLPVQSFYIKLGEANLHLPLTSALIHPKPLLQPLEHLEEELHYLQLSRKRRLKSLVPSAWSALWWPWWQMSRISRRTEPTGAPKHWHVTNQNNVACATCISLLK